MKLTTQYVCQNCGFMSIKWMGQCPECGQWNTFVEEAVEAPSKKEKKTKNITEFSSEITHLKDVKDKVEARIETGISELDNLLGGGLVKGQILLLAGAPGIGKSTLMLQTAAAISDKQKVLYISGEESLSQISSRALRLGLNKQDMYLLSETNLQNIIAAINKIKPEFLVIDSVQTVYHPEFTSSPGTIAQVRECAAELLRICKSTDTILFMLGHVTKDGELAGPKVLEHMVDSVLYFDTERDNILRLIRPHKNRFGSTSEIGLFEMTGAGLIPVTDANAYFSESSRKTPLKGRAYSVALEGTRPILTEVQVLVSPSRYPFPKRVATGIDIRRCEILLAAIEKHTDVNLDNRDVYISLAGGLKIKDPALDLALCAAVISSAKDIAISNDSVFIGEVGILGQLAKAPLMDRRIIEAGRLGFKKAFVPILKDSEIPAKSKVEAVQLEGLMDLSRKIR
ncbi:DNA repair protein RadA/Sms [Parelusimicrobium proximum]|uniref:DNA repair protein RadA n=1 Tax=Parelusimicrobium proximum TaxID=3228953 RepID=UPI003D17D08C